MCFGLTTIADQPQSDSLSSLDRPLNVMSYGIRKMSRSFSPCLLLFYAIISNTSVPSPNSVEYLYAVLVIPLFNHGPPPLKSYVPNIRHEWSRYVQNTTQERQSMMFTVLFSYTSHRWQLEMAPYLDDFCRSNNTLFGPDGRLSHLQTRMSFLKPD